jgi:hypothetical protein
MKLLYCPSCGDLVNLLNETVRACQCGRCEGQYVGLTKAVVRGPKVQVIAFDNVTFAAVMKKAVAARPGKPRDDYHLAENEFTAWVFGPNALAVTKATGETPRDRQEVAARATLAYAEMVDTLTAYWQRVPPADQARLFADVQAELARLAPLTPAV